ncbi:Acid-sensing ion channel 4-B [Labeo rohita]|uniref:Acid-sensing ion channel 4-B n=1 Tax=Labeo rohita TaxID=84645 RepID=A0ABQ8MKH4_LABRO|nr:Acid-sensing ion channel 4-B [Labeo rohita]
MKQEPREGKKESVVVKTVSDRCKACREGSICTPCLSYQLSLRFPYSLHRSLALSAREEFGQQLRQPLQLMPLLSLESTAVAHPGALTRRTKHLLSPSALCSSNSSRPQGEKKERVKAKNGRNQERDENLKEKCGEQRLRERSAGGIRVIRKGLFTALANHMPIEFVCKIKFAEGDEAKGASTEGGGTVMLDEGLRRRNGGMADLASFASSSSLHGLARVLGNSGRLGFRQTLWGLALLVSLGLFLYQATWSTATYLERPHLAAMREETRRELTFPAITLCNVNRFRFSALTDADIYHLANLTGLPPKSRKGHRPSELQYPPPDMLDIFQRTGHQLEDMLKSCNFSGQNCSSEDFSVVSSSGYEERKI